MSATCPACGAEQVDGLLCDRVIVNGKDVSCTANLERELAEVASIVGDLNITISRMDRVPSAGGPRRTTPPPPDEEPGLSAISHTRTPVGWRAVQAADDLGNCLTTWARIALNEQIPWRRYTSPTKAAARMLLDNMPDIRKRDDVAELVEGVTAGIRDARRAIDRPADWIYLGVCRFIEADIECQEELYAPVGADEVRCRTCGIEHPVAERRAWLLRRASDMLFTVEQASQMLGEVGGIRVTQASIRGYIHRKRIAYRPGGKMIRLGDLLAVVVDEGERRTA